MDRSHHQGILPKYTSDEERRLLDAIEVALPSLDLALKEVERLVELQNKQIDALDTKAQVFIALVGVVVAALYGNLKNLEDLKPNTLTLQAIGIAGLVFAAAGVVALLSYRIRDWRVVPNPERMKDYLTWDEFLTKYVLFDTTRELYHHNARETDRKARLLSISHYIFLVGAGILVVTFTVNLFFIK